jgi:hypothetical protein
VTSELCLECRVSLAPFAPSLPPQRTVAVSLQESATPKGRELEHLIEENLRILENESLHSAGIVTNQIILLLA